MPVTAAIPAPMKHAIMRALSKDREQRQATVRQFYEELAGAEAARGRPRAGRRVRQPHRGRAEPGAMPARRAAHVPVTRIHAAAARLHAPSRGACHARRRSNLSDVAAAAGRRAARERGGGKGLIIGLGAAAGVLAIVGVVIVVRDANAPKDDPPSRPPHPRRPPPRHTATAPEKPTSRAAAEPTATKAVTGVGATKKTARDHRPLRQPPPPAAATLTGDAACAEAKRLADNGERRRRAVSSRDARAGRGARPECHLAKRSGEPCSAASSTAIAREPGPSLPL